MRFKSKALPFQKLVQEEHLGAQSVNSAVAVLLSG